MQLVSQLLKNYRGSYWLWSYGGWIYNYLCNQCLSQLTLWVRTALRRGVLNTTFCDKVCQWLAAGWKSGYSGFLHQWYWPPRDNWCVVESGVKHNNTIPIKLYRWWHRFDCFYLVHSTVLGGKGIHWLTIQRLNGGLTDMKQKLNCESNFLFLNIIYQDVYYEFQYIFSL